MTENEAIKWLREMQNPMMSEAELYCAETYYGSGKMVYPEPEDYVFETAITALEEIQPYRAIGTVEEIEKSMQNVSVLLAEHELLKLYQSIGTIDEFKALKEKSVAKKPEAIDYEKYIGVLKNAKFLRGAYWCPNCKHTVRSGTYCDDCGQALDWS